MPTPCDHCGNPLAGDGLAGRPWPGRTPASYCCYGCLSLGEQRRQGAATPPAVGGWSPGGLGMRLAAGVLIAGQSMIFGLALNLHDDVPADVRRLAQSAILFATLGVVALLGGPLVRAAGDELRRGRLTVEALFVVTLAGAMGASLQSFLAGTGHIYFEVVSVLLVVYTLGKVVGARSRAAAVAASRAWGDQLTTCRIVDETGRTRVVPVADVRPGDVVDVRPGETVAVDGVVRTGVGFVAEAAVSGEPFAVVRRPGDRVLAGAASADATFRIEATTAGTERQVDHLLAAVEAARGRPASLQNRADAVGRVFLPLVVAVAGGTFLYWSFLTSAGVDVGLFHATSVLLVACPCAIGLATPVVVWSALGRLAERGVIVRSGDAVERLAEIDRVVFDKTGTLTDDRFTRVDIVTAATGAERATLLGWLALVQRGSRHPVAKPFAELPTPFADGEEPRVGDVRAVPGCGVVAEVEGHTLHIGRPEWVAAFVSGPASLADQLLATGHRVDVAVDGRLAAAAVVAERVRDSTPDALAGFRQMGLPVEVLTGDTADRAAALGVVDTRAGLLPDDKRRRVEAIRAAGGRPLVVGDGINDASALAAAHVGVALASGADLAVGAAAVTLYGGDLRALPWAVALSRAAVRAVRRNLLRAVAYNLVGMTLAAGGVLHPVVAVLLMVASSLSLLFSSVRVGVEMDHAVEDPPVATGGLSAPLIHAAAIALQGALVVALFPGVWAAFVLIAFSIVGVGLAWVWKRWAAIPHAVDMAFGMLTVGNAGMLAGWWADAGFAPVQCAHCCGGGVGMWVGMFAAANAAMLWLGRTPAHGFVHTLAMFTGGNVGMAVGMAVGGSVATTLVGHAGGMTAGMIAGMLGGTWAVEHLIGVARGLVGARPWVPRQPYLRAK